MKIFDKIQAILDRWLINLTVNDQRELNVCRDELWQTIADTKNTLTIEKQNLKDIEATRTLELNEEIKDDGKKKYTVAQVESLIQQETQEDKTKINTLLYTIDQLQGKLDAVNNYVINIRDYLKVIPTTQD